MVEENLVIIGSGPAGLTAAIYAARANLKPLLISGNEFGGQIAITNEVENYPGFDSILGPDLTEKMRAQAERFGTRFEINEVTEVDFTHGSPFLVKTYSEEYRAKAVIVATGASAKRLGIPGENDFIGRGVSYCATCDGFFFRNKDVLVVGGGDSALQEGLFLTKFASRVRIVHRRDSLRAGELLKTRAAANEKIAYVLDTALEEIRGNGAVKEVVAKNIKTGETQTLDTDGVFVFIGHYPNTQLFEGQLAMDEQKFIITDQLRQTSVPGVFAAGEVQDPIFKQAVSSAGQGCEAAISAERWLAAHGVE
ncbi:MAG: thioredoxin-disulfide reductase [Chloroflexi bacterium]|nr:thioredoxin-disulfide reductase [Chloroflexota bacterium]MBI4316485.1 thioredoxin-disulfide reductase [Chloroflexota bacterium]